MPNSATLRPAMFESSIPQLKLLGRGKVRDIYEIDARHLLIVTTDRMSAFDVILPDAIPDKGRVLTRISNFWFQKMQDLIPNHLCNTPSLAEVISDPLLRQELAERSIIVKRLTPLPVEAIVRGYLIGSGWKDYQHSGALCGIALPANLKLAQQLPESLYTPSSKAETGEHDQNISFADTVQLMGAELAEQVRAISLKLYRSAAEYALQRGIIIADTKFEFGVDEDGIMYWIDEALTPDSSRFWPLAGYKAGVNPPSFDKQYLRDYLETLDWDKTAPGPTLPEAVKLKCSEKYREAESKLLSTEN
jgi:phosphoribosylaminoimidazole-succinocarboxamide synthase